MPNGGFAALEEQLQLTRRERDTVKADLYYARQEITKLKDAIKVVQACSAEVGTIMQKISASGWRKIKVLIGKPRKHCQYRWSLAKKERKRMYDEMHRQGANQPRNVAMNIGNDRPRRPDGTFRPIVFTNIHVVDRTRPWPAVLETPERDERRGLNRHTQQNAIETPQQAQREGRAGSHLPSPPASANMGRTRMREGPHNRCTARHCFRGLTRKSLVEAMQKAAIDDLLRTGMTGHDYAVFSRKMNALKEYGTG